MSKQQQQHRSPSAYGSVLNSGSEGGFNEDFLDKLFLYLKIEKEGGGTFLFFQKTWLFVRLMLFKGTEA